MEELFRSARHVALNGNHSDQETDRMKDMIEGLRVDGCPELALKRAFGRQQQHNPCCLGVESEMGTERLNKELGSAKRILSQRLQAQVLGHKRRP